MVFAVRMSCSDMTSRQTYLMARIVPRTDRRSAPRPTCAMGLRTRWVGYPCTSPIQYQRPLPLNSSASGDSRASYGWRMNVKRGSYRLPHVASVLHGTAGKFRNPLELVGNVLQRVANHSNNKRPPGGGLSYWYIYLNFGCGGKI